jgi:hypothetical protein
MLRHGLFDILLLGTCGYALLKGGLPERLGALIALCGTLFTILVASTYLMRFRHVETGVFLVDLLVFAAFTCLADRSTRFWPVWIAGLQGATIIEHLVRLVAPGILPRAYMDAVALWSYPILALLLIGTVRHRRRLQLSGADPSWKTPAGA